MLSSSLAKTCTVWTQVPFQKKTNIKTAVVRRPWHNLAEKDHNLQKKY